MSLIMTYVGSKGCVMAGDKRSIGFLGDKNQREILEEELYSGKIKSTDELLKRAGDLDITLKITDNREKVRKLDNVLVGEVTVRATHETKRKRIYATTNGYHQIELLGTDIKDAKSGKSSIVIFGNKITKELANKSLKKHWKNKITLQEVKKIFEIVMEDVSRVTPSVSPDFEVCMIHPQIAHDQAMELLRTTIISDVKELEKWREKLRQDLLEKSREIQMASKIITEGEVGRVKKANGNEIEVILSEGVEALNLDWNVLARPGDVIIMKMNEPSSLQMGDMVVIENENLCLKKNKSPLSCDIILCKSD